MESSPGRRPTPRPSRARQSFLEEVANPTVQWSGAKSEVGEGAKSRKRVHMEAYKSPPKWEGLWQYCETPHCRMNFFISSI